MVTAMLLTFQLSLSRSKLFSINDLKHSNSALNLSRRADLVQRTLVAPRRCFDSYPSHVLYRWLGLAEVARYGSTVSRFSMWCTTHTARS